MISHPDKLSIEEQISLFAKVGFDSFFLSYGVTSAFEQIPSWSKYARKCGILFEGVHAPSVGMNDVWADGREGDDYISEIIKILEYCSNGQVEKLIMHVSGQGAPAVNVLGLDRYSRLEEKAESLGVRLCYENGDTVTHLEAVLKQSGAFHVFCYDSGHEACYTPDAELLDKWGEKLLYTHLHDNMGAGKGDLHYMPFDGIRDWSELARKLSGCSYKGTLNLELACHSNVYYRELSYAEFVERAKERGVRLSNLSMLKK